MLLRMKIRILPSLFFGATVFKTIRPMLSDRYLSVCNVGVLWPNGWMYQDET